MEIHLLSVRVYIYTLTQIIWICNNNNVGNVYVGNVYVYAQANTVFSTQIESFVSQKFVFVPLYF